MRPEAGGMVIVSDKRGSGMDFRVLGPFTVVREDEPLELGGFKQRAVLAVLLIDVNRVVSTDHLLEAVWGEISDAPRRRLWVYISNLRSLLEPERVQPGSGEVLLTHPSGYELSLSPDDLDVTRFERLTGESRTVIDTDPERAAELLREALGLWRGRAYQEFIYEQFAEDEIRRLEELRLQAVELRIDADLAAGRHQALIAEVEALAEDHPTRERFRAQHMLALYRSGRQAEAVQAFRRTQSYLVEELGLEPSQELQDLELAILDHNPRLGAGLRQKVDEMEPPMSLPGYELRKRIGEGTFGDVWSAYQPSVGREVAVKVIRPDLVNHPGFVRGFEAEARTIARLAHPHVVPLIDFWRDPKGAYLVLQLLPGGSLDELLRTGEVDVDAARRVLHQVGEALDHVHTRGVVHGDIQPENVLLDEAGNAYLTDFGIAARLVDSGVVAAVSEASRYQAPEQQTTGPSASADRYALGTLAAELLGENRHVESVIRRATAANPDDRYPSAGDFLVALDGALGEERTVLDRPTVVRNPYKGLRPFDESDAADFFGREDLVSTLVKAVDRHRFVTVVGPSGSGKSSVVRAGLLPALAKGAIEGSEGWLELAMIPGPDPINALIQTLEGFDSSAPELAENVSASELGRVLDRVLPESSDQLVLVVDQFEEVFTLVDSPERRQEFLALLMDSVEADHSRIRVVATLRADFYHQPLIHDRLGRLVADGLVTVLPPTWEELTEMISQPALAVGLKWEPELVHSIAQDVVGEPGGLPLLQFGLSEMVEQRRGPTLTVSDYQRVGGVTGALANRAEALYGELTPTQRRVTRQVLLRLVTVDEDSGPTRRRVRRSELELLDLDQRELDVVLDRFTAERLLLADRDPVTRGPTVEVAHETLLVEWHRLGEWIDEQRESLLMSRKLRLAMNEWLSEQEDPDYLLAGSRLAPFLAWSDTASLTDEEQTFLDASREREEAEQSARARRRRLLTGVLAGAGLVAALLATLAYIQGQRAADEAERAVAAESQAADEAARSRSRELTASAANVLGEDPELSILLALAAIEDSDPSLEAVTASHEAVQQHRTEQVVAWPREISTSIMGSISPDGQYLAVSGGLNEMAVWDLSDGSDDPIWEFEVPHRRFAKIVPRFTIDGSKVVATVSWFGIFIPPVPLTEPPSDVGIYVFDVETGQELQYVRGPPCPFIDLKQSSRYLDPSRPIAAAASLAEDCELDQVGIWLLDVESGESRLVYEGYDATESQWDIPMSLSADARLLALPDLTDEPTTKVIDLDSGEEVFSITGGGNARLNRAGTLLVAGGQSAVELWDVDTRTMIWRFDLRAAPTDYWFSEDESLVYGGGWETVVQVLDADTGEPVHQLEEHDIATWFHSMTTDNELLASFSSDGIRVWDVSAGGHGEIAGYDLPASPVLQGGNVVGERVAMIIYREEQRDFLPAPGRPPERLVAPGEAIVMDIPTGEVSHRFTGYGGRMVRLSPEGSRLAGQPFVASDLVGPVHIRDIETGVLVELEGLCGWDIAELVAGPDCGPGDRSIGQLGWLDFSPDGTMLAVNGQTAGVWDVETGRRLVWIDETNDTTVLRFNPDSDRLVVGTGGPPIAGIRVFETETWDLVSSQGRMGPAWWDLTFSPDGSRLLVLDLRVGVEAIDADTWQYVNPTIPPPIGRQDRDIDVSGDGSMIAIAGADGIVRLVDSETDELLQEIPIVVPGDSPEVTMAQFIDDHHLFVVAGDSSAMIVTTDVDELIEMARSRLTRGFTGAECVEFDFGNECPTLEELAGA